jgi:pilus assembly protein Flp/PilA
MSVSPRTGKHAEARPFRYLQEERAGEMANLRHLMYRITSDIRGQDLIEYALMAGFVAVAAGATFPPLANTISQIFSTVGSVLSAANAS